MIVKKSVLMIKKKIKVNILMVIIMKILQKNTNKLKRLLMKNEFKLLTLTEVQSQIEILLMRNKSKIMIPMKKMKKLVKRKIKKLL